METVRVGLGERAYDILIGPGLLAEAGARVAPLLPRPRTVIVTDETVAALHLSALRDGLDAGGIAAEAVILPPGEATKSMTRLAELLDRLLALGVERDDVILALGGGVIGDLAGFAAAVLRRGVDFVQVPTTLLAQVDSSVGGKTGVNAPAGKNLIGAFHQPRLVLADTAVLDTLSAREFRAGYAEVAKYALLGDAAFFDWLEATGPRCWPAPRRAHRRGAPLLRDEGRDRRARRDRAGRARAAQSRAHLRPCAGGGDGLFRPAAARRGGGDRHRPRLRGVGAHGALPPGDARARRGAFRGDGSQAPSCRHSRRSAGRGRADPADGPGQEGQPGPARPSSSRAGSARPSSRARPTWARCARCSPRNWPRADEGGAGQAARRRQPRKPRTASPPISIGAAAGSGTSSRFTPGSPWYQTEMWLISLGLSGYPRAREERRGVGCPRRRRGDRRRGHWAASACRP